MVRDLNDRLYALLRGLRSPAGDFECECGDAACNRLVVLTLGEYEAIRLNCAEPVRSPEHQS